MDHHFRSWTVILNTKKRRPDGPLLAVVRDRAPGACSPTPFPCQLARRVWFWERDGSDRLRSSALRCGQRDRMQCFDQGIYLWPAYLYPC